MTLTDRARTPRRGRNTAARVVVGVAVETLERDIRPETPAWKVWAALWTVYIVWGSTYLAIRVAVETLPPLLHAGVRFVLAGAVMYAFLRVRLGRQGTAVDLRQVGGCAVVGTALLLGGNGLVAIAEQEVPSALAALIISSVPLWLVIMRYATGEEVSSRTLVSVVVGFGGVAVLLGPGAPGGVALWGELLLVAASLSWAAGSFASRRLRLPPDPFVSTAVQMLCGGAALVLASVITGEAFGVRPESFSAASLAAFFYLLVIGSFAGFTAYTWVLQRAPISKVATYAYVNPVVAVVLGWVILSERITLTMLVGAAVIVASVAATVREESRPADVAAAARPSAGGVAPQGLPVTDEGVSGSLPHRQRR